VVNYNLNKLVDAGFLNRVEAKSRGLRLVREFPGGRRRKVIANTELFQVRYAGQIVAGEPINVYDDSQYDEDRAVEVPASMLGNAKPDEVFALTVSGDSMIDAMIQDGDTIIMQTNTCNQWR
jgi:repressor LexA